MIRSAQVSEAIAWVDRSGVAEQIETLLRPTLRGRPRQLTVRALLVGVKLAIDEAKTSCLNDVHRILTQQLSEGDQRLLEVRNRQGRVVSVHQVRRLFSSVAAKLDPSRHHNPHLDDVQSAERHELLQSVLDQLLDATMTTGVTHHGAYAVDGTGVWSWARGKRRGQPTADNDAAWGSKTAKSGGQEPFYGYEMHALVRINSTRQDRDAVPCLAERIVVTPAAVNGVTAIAPTLRALAAQEKIREIVADRGYSYKTNWATELHALGIDPVFDLHTTQYGARGIHDGARMIVGVPHCPATPTGLDTITRPERLSESPELDAFVNQIAKRQRWAFRRITTADTEGSERFECPARAGKVRCALYKPSLAKPLALPTVTAPPSDAPTCCTQRTISVPGDVDAKNRQRHYWGSREWVGAFTRRSRVEGWFGNLKSNNTENLTRGSFRVTGIAKTSLMLAVYAAATNMRLLNAWRRRTEPEATPAGPGSPERAVRRAAKRQPLTRRSIAPPG